MYLDDLNTQQRHLVEDGDGVVTVTAGPGTGKTRTLTYRVAYLITEKYVLPQNILVLTFTNRAAEEMKDRLKSLICKGALPLVTTFHGFVYYLLTSLGQEIRIISEEEQNKILKEVIKIAGIKISGKDLSRLISLQKSTPRPQKLASQLKRLIDEYNLELERLKLSDFDDLLLKTYQLFFKDSSLKTMLQQQYQYILIDEFQDTNELQYEIIKQILKKSPNLFVIGDPNQSIYGFRGAHSLVFQKLKRDFKGARQESLTTNYRSCKSIVILSNQLFSTKLNPFRSEDGQVVLLNTLNEFSEADWIIKFINQTIGGISLLQSSDNNQVTFADFAVIYRTHQLANILEKRFSQSGMPYQVVREDTPVEGDHIKLLSMHAVKGLEFKYVFLCGFEEGLIPYLKKDADLEEEKRLFYVAMTRAREELYLLYARKRGSQVSQLSSFARFLEHPSLIEGEDKHIEKTLKRVAKAKLKKSQIALF